MKVLHLICQQVWKSQNGHRTGKVSFHSSPKERQCQRMFKLLQNCTHLTHLQSNAQILQTGLQQYMNQEFPDVQADFRKGRETRDQTANIRWITEKVREF